MSFFDGEDWFFQIDSHMDFDLDWDERLIQKAQALQAQNQNIVISTYPDGFEIKGDQVLRPERETGVFALRVASTEEFTPDAPILYFIAQAIAGVPHLEGFSLGAGCLFAPGHFVQAFPYDPYYYFHGEEQALTLRLYTHGWSIFHVADLPIYHLYASPDSGAPARPLHWDAAEERERAQSGSVLRERSNARLRALMDGQALGIFGLGQRRSLADYAAFCGIDYRLHQVEARAFQELWSQPTLCLAEERA